MCFIILDSRDNDYFSILNLCYDFKFVLFREFFLERSLFFFGFLLVSFNFNDLLNYCVVELILIKKKVKLVD